jgi:hypothetical protein
MSLSVVPVANLTSGQYLAGILDNATTSKLWSVTPYSSAAAGDAEAPAPGDCVKFPTVEEVEVDAAPDGTGNVGLVTIVYAPNAEDDVDNGPWVLQTSPNALAIVSSSSSG